MGCYLVLPRRGVASSTGGPLLLGSVGWGAGGGETNMANELSDALTGANVLHEGCTVIRDFVLSDADGIIDLAATYQAAPGGFRSLVKNVIDGTTLATATLSYTPAPIGAGDGTDGMLRWRLDVADTINVMQFYGTGESNVNFVMDIEADHLTDTGPPEQRTDYLGSGSGQVQRGLTDIVQSGSGA